MSRGHGHTHDAARACTHQRSLTLPHPPSAHAPCPILASLSAIPSATPSAHTPLSPTRAGQLVEFVRSRRPWTGLTGLQGGLHLLHMGAAHHACVHLLESRHEPRHAALPAQSLCPLTALHAPHTRLKRAVWTAQAAPTLVPSDQQAVASRGTAMEPGLPRSPHFRRVGMTPSTTGLVRSARSCVRIQLFCYQNSVPTHPYELGELTRTRKTRHLASQGRGEHHGGKAIFSRLTTNTHQRA